MVVTSVSSDAHTWNLVHLQLVLEELGHQVVNLGACVPDDLVVSECLRTRPALVVVSSVNGHGYRDGLRLIGRIRANPDLARTPVVIGGKLGINGSDGRDRAGSLRSSGFDAVFERATGMDSFISFVTQLSVGVGK
ncbi:cobalamin-dependent protein [Amycolatopsis sp. NPDC051128]|uniref:cobalamin B12-binding domain-containing protein n=1 Tax=Amycolatopsis sp. NPDC051128 TaxID=3155412 RepID=UPI00343989AC